MKNVTIPSQFLQELLALCGPEDHELRERVLKSAAPAQPAEVVPDEILDALGMTGGEVDDVVARIQDISAERHDAEEAHAALAATQQGLEPITGPCGQCKDSHTPCACTLQTMLKERGLTAVDEKHYLKISQQAKSNTNPAQQGLDAQALKQSFREYLSVSEHIEAGGQAMDSIAADLTRIVLAAAPTQQGLDARELPAMTPELASILGLMCFQCIPFAQALRAGGQQINTRAEDEQAAVLHWMLGHYFRHGEAWRDAAAEDMERMKADAVAAQAKQGGV